MLLLLSIAARETIAVAADEPLGIAMENYTYPHPVQYFPLSIEGQDLRMAYMDVPSTSPQQRGVVVLLHGKNFFGAYWANTIRVLNENGYRVIAPDQIGFGKSSKPDIHYSFHLLAKNTHDLLTSIGVQRASVVGHSMGGMLATRFALMYPEFTTKLVLENPIGLEDYKEKAPYVPTEKLYQQQLAQTVESLRAYQKRYYVQWKPEYDEYVLVQARWMQSGEWPRLAWSAALTTQMIYEQPVSHEFGLIKVPTMLVLGQSDRTAIGKERVSPQIAATMGNYPELGMQVAATIRDAKLVPIENCGHIPHFEMPEKFHAALIDFLGDSDPK
jgi:pimeloyl-ACP methyl ester carboxylesterase